jgi:hypothetical protein
LLLLKLPATAASRERDHHGGILRTLHLLDAAQRKSLLLLLILLRLRLLQLLLL